MLRKVRAQSPTFAGHFSTCKCGSFKKDLLIDDIVSTKRLSYTLDTIALALAARLIFSRNSMHLANHL